MRRSILIIGIADAWILSTLIAFRGEFGAYKNIIIYSTVTIMAVYTFLWLKIAKNRTADRQTGSDKIIKKNPWLLIVAAIYAFGAIRGMTEVISGALPKWTAIMIIFVGTAIWLLYDQTILFNKK